MWAYKNAAELEMQKLKILVSMLTGQDLMLQPEQSNEFELTKMGIGAHRQAK